MAEARYVWWVGGRVVYLTILFLLPTWAEKPVLMAVTERLEPQLLQVTKYSLFSPLLSSGVGAAASLAGDVFDWKYC